MSKELEALEDIILYLNANESKGLYYENIKTIQQALLKAQEPKQYLKWEDLEFSEKIKVLEVKMNNNDYILHYTLDIFGNKCCFLYDSAITHHIDLTRQFFNDLHLEVLE